MAETVHLTLIAAVGGQIEGDSTETTMGREDTIECFAFEQVGKVPMSSSGATGRRSYQPIRIVKAIDRATPLLAKALTENQSLTGTFRFYRPSPSDGTTEQFFTIEIRDGRVASVRQFVLDAGVATQPPLEEVTFAFRTISWTFVDGGIVHEDTWTSVA